MIGTTLLIIAHLFFGYLLISLKDSFWNAVTKNRLKFLISGVIGFPLLMCLWYVIHDFPLKGEVQASVKVFNAWSWILTLIGYAAIYTSNVQVK